MPHHDLHKKLQEFLAGVQKEVAKDDFIYGVTSAESRSSLQKVQDFFIDRSRVSQKEKAYFFDLLSTMLRAGISINRALKILSRRTEDLHLRRVIATLSYELEHGRSFASALDRFPDVFSESERGALRSAEAVGHMEPMLAKMAKHLERNFDLRMKLVSALIYPIAVLIALSLTTTIMLIFVIPQIREIFAESGAALPLATQVLLQGSLFLQNFWWALAMALIIALMGWNTWMQSEEGRFWRDFKVLQLPLAGNLLRKIYAMRFTDTLGVLLESGQPIHQALEYVSGSVGNEAYRLKTLEALHAVQDGKKLSLALSDAPFLFPETVSNILAIGEQSASLGEVSQKISLQLEREIRHSLQTLTSLAGPLLVLVIGAGVAFFALAVLSPLFSLGEVIQ